MNVALLVTCLVDLFRPQAGFAAIRLLERAGCTVVVPPDQTCCGQPAWNSGDRKTAQAIARRAIEIFEPYDRIVVPSGSCAGMLGKHYPEIFDAADPWQARAAALAAKTVELTRFLAETGIAATIAAQDSEPTVAVALHDSCSALRETGSAEAARQLLRMLGGIELHDLADPGACCGFGGTFCVKYPAISDDMVTRKARDIAETGAAMLTSCDLGCLLNIAGKFSRDGTEMRCFHIAEILAGMTDGPAIGEGGLAR